MNIYDVETFGWKKAIQGMRFSFDSEKESDSTYNPIELGEKDFKLMCNLIKGGASHRKFLRCIHIQFICSANMTWWKQYDTYKVATTALSRSTMHTITKRFLEADDFSPVKWTDDLLQTMKIVNNYITQHNYLIVQSDLESKRDAKIMFQMITDMLPMCYNQERVLDINYETALTIIKQRKHHKLPEWEYFCEALFTQVPYLKEFYEAMEK